MSDRRDDRTDERDERIDTDSFTLDPQHNRIRTETAGGHTLTNHYNDNTDSPSWIDNGDTTWTRDISGIDGNLAASQASAGTVTLELPDLKGNVGATAPDTTSATGVTATYAYTEFGLPETGITDPTTYGSLGAKQRSTGDLGGLSLMGERLYNAVSGRFLQVDPVPGGSANRYDYCDQDPINQSDLSGRTSVIDKWSLKFWAKVHKLEAKHHKYYAQIEVVAHYIADLTVGYYLTGVDGDDHANTIGIEDVEMATHNEARELAAVASMGFDLYDDATKLADGIGFGVEVQGASL